MSYAFVDSLTEAEAELKLAEYGQLLRRKAHLPANVADMADALGQRLIDLGATYSGSTLSNLTGAAKGALSVTAGVAAIQAAA